ncbi:hypothetical protein ACG74X_13180 [Marivita sp. S0852]|uniref:hypothetical protein n=1 Tax=Marivita sp. S0852 TaxID=3373893 RepID=UPI003981D5B1
MKRALTAILFCTLAGPVLADDAETYPHCSYTPASAIGPMFETQSAADCEAACKENAGEGCTAWSYMGPSAMFPDKPGNCRMIKEIFKEETGNDRFRCGKI